MCVESVTGLLARGWLMGAHVEVDGHDLVVRGPRSAEPFVMEVRARKTEVVSHLQQVGCGALHIKPERWKRISGKAYCPRCRRFMGYLMTSEQVPQGGVSHAR